MSEMNDYYVYGHYKIGEDNIPFYIGFGRGRRAKSKEKRNKHWHSVVDKYGYQVKLLCEQITKNEAKQLEVQLIGMFGRSDIGKGPLVNKTNGGDSSNGKKFEKGHVTWNKGIPLAEDAKRKMIKTKTGQPSLLKGKKRPPFTEAWKNQMSDSAKKKVFTDAHKQALKDAWIVRRQKKNDSCPT
jgi:hypothetical protein